MVRRSLVSAGISTAALLLSFLAAAPQPVHAGSPTITIEKAAPTHSGPVIVACVGDSITAGVGASVGEANYPSLLGDLLGPQYKVINFGESGATLLKNGDSPYWKRPSFDASASAAPDVVVIMLGANDSKPQNWVHKDEFASDYKALIEYFAKMPSSPQIFLCTPTPVPEQGNYGINEPVVEQEITIIEQVAALKKLPVIDVHAGVPDLPSEFADNVHPNDGGYVYLASSVYFGLTHAPVIEPIRGRINSPTSLVTIVALDSSSTVRFTVDGSSPTSKSPAYMLPFTLPVPLTKGSGITVSAQVFHGKKPSGLISTAFFAGPAQ